MAGAGFDAAMIRDAGDGGLKERFGRVAYVWTGSKNLRSKPFRAEIKVDGVGWYKGKASCILLGNVGELFGGVEAFEDARPDDGKLELGVVTADGLLEWGRMIARTAVGTASKSPFAQTTKARSVKVKLNRKILYELDGGDRTKVKTFKVKVEAGAITVCVPNDRAKLQLKGGSHAEFTDNEHAPVAAELPARASSSRGRFEYLSRAGFVARGLVYGIIGILALKLALGQGGKLTNQQGALHTVAHQPFGKVLLTLVAIGLGGYALWRLVRAAIGHGPEGTDSGFDRVAALASGIVYGGDVRARGRDPARRRRRELGQREEADRGRARLAGGHLDRRPRRSRDDRRRPLSGLPRDHQEVPRRLEDRGDGRLG